MGAMRITKRSTSTSTSPLAAISFQKQGDQFHVTYTQIINYHIFLFSNSGGGFPFGAFIAYLTPRARRCDRRSNFFAPFFLSLSLSLSAMFADQTNAYNLFSLNISFYVVKSLVRSERTHCYSFLRHLAALLPGNNPSFPISPLGDSNPTPLISQVIHVSFSTFIDFPLLFFLSKGCRRGDFPLSRRSQTWNSPCLALTRCRYWWLILVRVPFMLIRDIAHRIVLILFNVR